MAEVEIAEAGADLRGLVERAGAGEDVVLVEEGRRPAGPGLEPERGELNGPRVLGRLQGQFKIPDDFDAPLPDDIIDLFYNGPIFPDASPGPDSLPQVDGGRPARQD